MIRIFKRIKESLLNENRFKSYMMYAIGEIVLIVIGILIAVQINNWNESKKSDAKIKSVLLLIKDNLKEDKAELELNLEIGKKKFLNYWQTVLEKNPADGDYSNLINHLGVYDFNSNNSGYLSAIRGDILSLIDNRELVNNITAYYELKFREMENRSAEFARWTLLMTNLIFDSFARNEKIKGIRKRTQIVISDPVFKETLLELLSTTKDLLKKISDRIISADSLIAKIEMELSIK
ncbi:hypothetical protein MNBD_IGNAVI01-2995 [hydrothermal vent metagenome]|uniref:Uncharacterized protein n=1 Tax=hydrothermal vent metagenome TaxID=652676 RepID=A0A3B1C3V4_9ZZZZ